MTFPKDLSRTVLSEQKAAAEARDGRRQQEIQQNEYAKTKALVKEGKNCTSCRFLGNRLVQCKNGKKIYSVYSICHLYTER